MKPALIVSLAAGLAASGPLFGQAMIGYGVGVGRAGAAGAATGAGAASIFSGVKGELDQRDSKPDPAAARQATAEEIEKAKKEEKKEETSESSKSEQKDRQAPAAATWDSGTLTTSNGFVISGLQRRPTRSGYPPTAPGPVVKIDRPAPPVSSDAAAAEDGSEGSQGGEARRTGPSGVFEPIVMSFGTAKQDSPQEASANGSSPAPLSLEIPAGTPIADLVKRFGEPVLALTGISGEDYTEKYVFRTPEGARLTVLSVEGRVTSFVVDNGDDAERAAL
jgi:hypothetical protein